MMIRVPTRLHLTFEDILLDVRDADVSIIEGLLGHAVRVKYVQATRMIVLRGWCVGAFHRQVDGACARGWENRLGGPLGVEHLTARTAGLELELVESRTRSDHPALVGTVPPDHLLPWPHPRKCELYWTPAEVFREIVMRRRSALAHGAIPPEIPRYLDRRLTPELVRRVQDMRHMDSQRASMFKGAQA
jgi:hypothetical protein